MTILKCNTSVYWHEHCRCIINKCEVYYPYIAKNKENKVKENNT